MNRRRVMVPIPEPPAVTLARAALDYAIADDRPAMVTVVGQILARYGGRGVYAALVAWCDFNLEHATGLRDVPPTAANVWFLDTDTGRRAVIGEVDGRLRWIAQLIAARAAGDQQGFDATILTLPDDPRQRGMYLVGLVGSIAETFKLPAGYALMGKTA